MKAIFYAVSLVFCSACIFSSVPTRAQIDNIFLPLISAEASELTLPIRAAFYYPWYPNAWKQQGFDPFTQYTPDLGSYDSADREVIRQHIEAMQYGHIQAGIASWWGQDHHTDGRISTLLDVSKDTGFRWALYYEEESQRDPTVAELEEDLIYIRDQYGQHDNYLRLGGRLVLFIYADTANAEDDCEMVDRWEEANTINAYIVHKVFRGYRDCPNQPDGWHQYAPAVAFSHQKGYSYTISPGFWKMGVDEPRLQRNFNQWQSEIRKMIDSDEPFQLISTFNEWGEGTSIESAQEWQSESGFGIYLDALHHNGVDPSAPPTTGTPTEEPGTTIPPVQTPTPELTVHTVKAVADAYVNQGKVTTNYGRASTLRTDKGPEIRSYLRFEVPEIEGHLVKAALRIYNISGSSLGYEVRNVSNNNWEEYTIKYSTAPTIGHVIDSSGAAIKGTWSELDVTRAVTGTGSVSFAILNLMESATSYGSRESDVNAPQLVISSSEEPIPEPTGGEVLLTVGDIADCESVGDDATADLVDGMPGSILALGDVVYPEGTAEDFADCYEPTWGRHKARTRPVVGNHEYLTPDAAPYYEYFGEAAGDPDKGYYSYDLGNWHIIVLNSNCVHVGGCRVSSPQEQWLRADLAAHPNRCTIAAFHYPLLSSGRHQKNPQVVPLVEALVEHKVELLLAGHAHNYERFEPMDAAGNLDLENGIRQIIVGTGGKNHETAYFNVLPNSKIRNDDTFGVLKLNLYEDSYRWEFVPIAGKTFTDSGFGTCR